MRMEVALAGFGVDARWAQKRDPRGKVSLRILWRLTRREPESLEQLVARSVDQAIAELAREMGA